MEIVMRELDVTTKRRRAIMDRVTLLEKGICIPDLE
jgi:hypothetical protein